MSYREHIHMIIQGAVQRAGGDWKQSFEPETEHILSYLRDMLDVLAERHSAAHTEPRNTPPA